MTLGKPSKRKLTVLGNILNWSEIRMLTKALEPYEFQVGSDWDRVLNIARWVRVPK
jgi:hypothetical protein